MREVCKICGRLLLELPLETDRDIVLLYGFVRSAESIVMGRYAKRKILIEFREAFKDMLKPCCKEVIKADPSNDSFCDMLKLCRGTVLCVNRDWDVIDCVYDIAKFVCTSIIRDVFCREIPLREMYEAREAA